MKATAKILKVEAHQDGDQFIVTLRCCESMRIENFDLAQLGGLGEQWEEPRIENTLEGDEPGIWFVYSTLCKLKAGDSITNEEGGEPVIGEVREENAAWVDPRDEWAVRANEEARGEFHAKYGSRDSKENRKA